MTVEGLCPNCDSDDLQEQLTALTGLIEDLIDLNS
jgi:hypothetical protein